MNLTALSTLQIGIFVAIAVLIVVGVCISVMVRKRRTTRLRSQFGGAEYTRAVREGGSRKSAEAALDERADRVERLQIRPLGAGDRARFAEAWMRAQERFVDGPGGAVIDADRLVGDVILNSARRTSRWIIRWSSKITAWRTIRRFAKHAVRPARKICGRR
jgi:MFS superfamily sulfate permease-like transporter